MPHLHVIEKGLWLVAACLVLAGAGVGMAGRMAQEARLERFAAIEVPPATAARLTDGTPDRSDWSEARRARHDALRAVANDVPEAIIRIPDLRIEAEIFGDTTERSLDLGVGRIEGTASYGVPGNLGIAGHRDGYFRRLQDVRVGQTIEVHTQQGRWRYEVTGTRVVDPHEVHVLDPTPGPTLTLVTCYPFRFLGKAPQRFIVHARLSDAAERVAQAESPSGSGTLRLSPPPTTEDAT